MTRDEFITQYAEHSRVEPEDLRRKLGLFAVSCDCGEEGCHGWRMIHVLSLTLKEIAAMPEIVEELAVDA